jgi:hypothetical protein
MIVIFTSFLLLLVIVGAFRKRLQEATLHWGRAIAGQGQIERDIQEAKDSGQMERAAEMLGCSIHNRGLQDELTPPRQRNLTVVYGFACVGMYVWGFFVLPWYVALPWPIFFGLAERFLKEWLPAPSSNHYRQKIISSLISRQNSFERKDDVVRVQATEYLLALLRRSD